MFRLAEAGYHVGGIEIRKEAFIATRKKFYEANISCDLVHGNIYNEERHFDLAFSSGLLQCLDYAEQEHFIKKIKGISDKAVFIVPQRNKELLGKGIIGVAGCKEYSTGNIIFLLSNQYSEVRCGHWNKNKIKTDENFLYFICK